MPEEIFDEYGNNIFISVYDTDTPEQVAAMLNVPGFTNSEEIETETAMAM